MGVPPVPSLRKIQNAGSQAWTPREETAEIPSSQWKDLQGLSLGWSIETTGFL